MNVPKSLYGQFGTRRTISINNRTHSLRTFRFEDFNPFLTRSNNTLLLIERIPFFFVSDCSGVIDANLRVILTRPKDAGRRIEASGSFNK